MGVLAAYQIRGLFRNALLLTRGKRLNGWYRMHPQNVLVGICTVVKIFPGFSKDAYCTVVALSAERCAVAEDVREGQSRVAFCSLLDCLTDEMQMQIGWLGER